MGRGILKSRKRRIALWTGAILILALCILKIATDPRDPALHLRGLTIIGDEIMDVRTESPHAPYTYTRSFTVGQDVPTTIKSVAHAVGTNRYWRPLWDDPPRKGVQFLGMFDNGGYETISVDEGNDGTVIHIERPATWREAQFAKFEEWSRHFGQTVKS
jgi:hypothetical protein